MKLAIPPWLAPFGRAIATQRPAVLALIVLTMVEVLVPGGKARAQACQPNLILSELVSLQTAMEMAWIDTGFIHTIENLDDLGGRSPSQTFNDITDGGLGTLVLMPSTGRFRTTRANLLNPLRWRGPYVAYQPTRIDALSTYDPGTLLDLSRSGQPYHLYSPLGLVSPTSESITLEGYGDVFDRWTLASAGCDGVWQTADDVVLALGPGFGGPPTVPVISSVRAQGTMTAMTSSRSTEPLQVGDTILIRGYNFGSSQGTSRLLAGGFDLGQAESWSTTEMVVTLPPGIASGDLELEIGGTVVDRFPITIFSTVSHWMLFE